MRALSSVTSHDHLNLVLFLSLARGLVKVKDEGTETPVRLVVI